MVIEVSTSGGHRCLKLGPSFRVTRSVALHAQLDQLLGAALVGDDVTREAAPAAVA